MNPRKLTKFVTARTGPLVKAAASGDRDGAVALLDQIEAEGGLILLIEVMAGMIVDSAREAQGIPAGTTVTLAAPMWRNAVTGQASTDARSIPGYAAWCGQFIVASANQDDAMREALLTALPAGPSARPYAMTLLHSCVARRRDPGEVTELTARALTSAAHEDWETTMGIVSRVIALRGADGLTRMLLTAADWFIAAARPPGLTRDIPFQPGWIDAETGAEIDDASEVDSACAWAGRLIAARANQDEPMTGALLKALPAGRDEAACYITALLYACAPALTAAPPED